MTVNIISFLSKQNFKCHHHHLVNGHGIIFLQACSDRGVGGRGGQGAMALALFLRLDYKNAPIFDYCVDISNYIVNRIPHIYLMLLSFKTWLICTRMHNFRSGICKTSRLPSRTLPALALTHGYSPDLDISSNIQHTIIFHFLNVNDVSMYFHLLVPYSVTRWHNIAIFI